MTDTVQTAAVGLGGGAMVARAVPGRTHYLDEPDPSGEETALPETTDDTAPPKD